MGNTAGRLCISIATPKHSRNKRRLLKNTPESSKTEQHQQQQQQQSSDYNTNSNNNNEPPPLFMCEICVELKSLGESFNAEKCTHFYCIQCTVKYIESKLRDNVLILTCPQPECPGLLEPSSCRAILPHNVLMMWQRALCESAIPEEVKFYCPFKDCSALMINDNDNDRVRVGGKGRELVCPHCRRKICVECKVAWHSGLSCVRFQRLKHSEDALMMDLAVRKNWRRCPMCRQFVEKKSGCDFIKCRCQHAFCYNCGASMKSIWHLCKTQ